MNIKQYISGYKGEVNYTFSNMVNAAVTMISGIVAAAFIDPSDLGVIQTVLLVQTYVNFLHLGVFNGLNRNLAYYKAKNDLVKMQDEIDTSHTISWIVAIIGFVVGLCLLVYYLFNGYDNVYIWSSVLLLITLFFNPLTIHVESTFRSGQQFGSLGNIKNLQSLVYFISSFLPIICGYIGRVLSNIVNIVFGYYARLFKIPYKHKAWGSWGALKDLLSAGFPLLVAGYVGGVLSVADRTLIAANLGMEPVGYYTIAGYCMSIFLVVTSSLNSLLYPKAATIYGQTGSRKALFSFWKKSIAVFCAVIIPCALIAYIVLPYLVELFLPKYAGGIRAAQITLLTCVTYIYLGPSVLFGTFKKNTLYIIALALDLAFFWGVASLFRSQFDSIEKIALLRFLTSLVMMVFVVVYSYRLVKNEKKDIVY